MKQDTVLKVNNFNASFEKNGQIRPILENINFSLTNLSNLTIIGESGSGKSLLCKSILALIPEKCLISGEIVLSTNGETKNILNIKKRQLTRIRGKEIGMLFQNPVASLNPVRSCGKQISDALSEKYVTKSSKRLRVLELLSLVGFDDPNSIINKFAHDLSGGMAQKVSLAIALAGDPKILIADEPTSSLDIQAGIEILDLLHKIKTESKNFAIINVSHDIGQSKIYADDILVLYNGHILEYGKKEQVLSSPNHPYTEALLKCENSFYNGQKVFTIPGKLSYNDKQFLGCVFAPRCKYVKNLCRVENPNKTKTDFGFYNCHFPVEKHLVADK